MLKRRTNTLIVTNDCNLRCEYCYIPGRKKIAMPKETLITAINTLPRAEETIWEFIGGEPLLEPDLIDCAVNLLEKKQEKYIASITTNGTQFADKEVRRMLERHSRKKSVGLSIDGPKHVHDANRCNSFDAAMEYFDWWRKTFPWSATKSTVNQDTLPYLAETVRFLVSLGLTNIPINIIYEADWTKEDEKIYAQQLAEVSELLISLNNPKVSVSLFNRVFAEPVRQKRNWCGSGESMVAVSPDGNLYPCNRFADLDLPALGTLETGVNPDRLYPFKVSHFKIDDCSSCEIMGKCPGCLAYDYMETGTIFKRSNKVCSMHKVLVDANKVFWDKVQKQ